MKIVVQNFKTGVLRLDDAAPPALRPDGLLVRTTTSLISGGTDRAVIGLARKGYLGKALDRPDLARKVLRRARSEGLWSTLQVVRNLIADPIPLGYSLCGEAIGVGREVHGIAPGQRVACAGLGHASHAQIVSIPRNLAVPVPDRVDDEVAAYVALGAVALHGVRQADQQLGARVLVVGLGLVGQLTVQLCHAAGLRVIGVDLEPRKLALAARHGALAAHRPDDPGLAASVARLCDGSGVDAVLLTAAAREGGRGLFRQIAELCRDRARIVVVGDVNMDIERRAYFEKELEIVQSRSYGPGRYDRDYEEKGRDYPIGYVRWTERRNMEAFLALAAEGRIDVKALTTHRFALERAEQAYALVTGERSGFSIGVLLDYGEALQAAQRSAAALPAAPPAPAASCTAEPRRRAGRGLLRRGAPDALAIGVIGAGQFARGILLPAFARCADARIAAVASARGLSADAVARRYGAGYASSDPERVLDDPAIQAVVIATRHASHAALAEAALERGKHVFVEKPLCLQESELARLESAAQSASGILMVGFNRRFSPLFRRMAEHFRGRQEPLTMLYRVNAPRIPQRAENGWVHDPESGGGRIVGEVCHFVDAMQALCESRPVSLSADAVDPGRGDLVSSDIVTLTVRFADGSLGTVHYWSNGDESFPKERFEAFGQSRIAVLDNYRRLSLVARGRTRTHRSTAVQKGFDEEVRAFLDGCRAGRPPIALASLIDTTRVTLRAVAHLERRGDEIPPGAARS